MIISNIKPHQNNHLPLKILPLQKMVIRSPFRQKVLEKEGVQRNFATHLRPMSMVSQLRSAQGHMSTLLPAKFHFHILVCQLHQGGQWYSNVYKLIADHYLWISPQIWKCAIIFNPWGIFVPLLVLLDFCLSCFYFVKNQGPALILSSKQCFSKGVEKQSFMYPLF